MFWLCFESIILSCFKYTEFFLVEFYVGKVFDARVKGIIDCGVVLVIVMFVLNCA
jgi:hypothetical protein